MTKSFLRQDMLTEGQNVPANQKQTKPRQEVIHFMFIVLLLVLCVCFCVFGFQEFVGYGGFEVLE